MLGAYSSSWYRLATIGLELEKLDQYPKAYEEDPERRHDSGALKWQRCARISFCLGKRNTNKQTQTKQKQNEVFQLMIAVLKTEKRNNKKIYTSILSTTCVWAEDAQKYRELEHFSEGRCSQAFKAFDYLRQFPKCSSLVNLFRATCRLRCLRKFAEFGNLLNRKQIIGMLLIMSEV